MFHSLNNLFHLNGKVFVGKSDDKSHDDLGVQTSQSIWETLGSAYKHLRVFPLHTPGGCGFNTNMQ